MLVGPFGTTLYSYFKDSLDNYKISVYKNKEHLSLTNCINYKFKLYILILITGNMQLSDIAMQRSGVMT